MKVPWLAVRTAGLLVGVGMLATAGCSGSGGAGVSDSPGTPNPSVTGGLSAELLLGPDEMPDWNEAGVWQRVRDEDLTEADVLKACPLVPAESLGAIDSVSVVFEYVIVDGAGSGDDDYPPLLGVNTVAQFPDAATAASAVAAWERSLQACSAYRSGVVEGGSSWTVSAIDPEGQDEAWFDFTAIGSDDARTTLIGFSVYGQDANYDGDPLEAALPTSLDRLNH